MLSVAKPVAGRSKVCQRWLLRVWDWYLQPCRFVSVQSCVKKVNTIVGARVWGDMLDMAPFRELDRTCLAGYAYG